MDYVEISEKTLFVLAGIIIPCGFVAVYAVLAMMFPFFAEGES